MMKNAIKKQPLMITLEFDLSSICCSNNILVTRKFYSLDQSITSLISIINDQPLFSGSYSIAISECFYSICKLEGQY